MKSIFFVTAFLLGVFMAGAQNMHTHAEFGIKGGLNVSDVHIDNTTNPDTKVSGNFGILAHVHLTQQFAFQPELLFSGQGYSQTIAGTTYKTSLNYITLPILGQIMFGDGYRIETGPQPGILASAHVKSGGNSANEKDHFKTADFSWVFGLGYVSHSGLGVDARYNLGLSNISADNGGSIQNRVFAVGLFYQFKQ